MLPRLIVLAMGAVGLLAAAPSGANAAQFPLGQDTGIDNGCNGSGWSVLQVSTAGPPDYAAPADGTITSWSFGTNNHTDDIVKLRVFRPTADPNQFLVVGDSAPQGPLPPNTVNGPFQTSIPVKAGDIVGLHIIAATFPMCEFDGVAGDNAKEVNPDNYNVGDVATTMFDDHMVRVNIAATLSTSEPATPVTPTTPVKRKKCKKHKKKHRSAESAKKKKCKKKKRR